MLKKCLTAIPLNFSLTECFTEAKYKLTSTIFYNGNSTLKEFRLSILNHNISDIIGYY